MFPKLPPHISEALDRICTGESVRADVVDSTKLFLEVASKMGDASAVEGLERLTIYRRSRDVDNALTKYGYDLTDDERARAIFAWKAVMFGGPGGLIAAGLERLRQTERPRMSFAVDVETREIPRRRFSPNETSTRATPNECLARGSVSLAEAIKLRDAWLDRYPGFVLDGPRRPFEPSRDGITNACGEIPLPGSGGTCNLAAALEDVPCLECNKLAPFTCAAHPMSKGLSWSVQKALPPGTYDVTVESTTTVGGRPAFGLVDKDGDIVATATLPPKRRYLSKSVEGVTVEKVEMKIGRDPRNRFAHVHFDTGETHVIPLDSPFTGAIVRPTLSAFSLGHLFEETASKVEDKAPIMFAFLELALLGRKVDVQVTSVETWSRKKVLRFKITPSIPFTPAD